jgi:hypothetical protein
VVTGYDAVQILVEAHRNELIREADNERLVARLPRPRRAGLSALWSVIDALRAVSRRSTARAGAETC